jgi:outer membrane protein assembly factor BamB
MAKFLTAFFALLVISACSSNDSSDVDLSAPAELQDFAEEKEFDKLWSESIGDGQGDLYTRINPVIDGDVIYIASADGEVEAFRTVDGDDVWATDVDIELVGGVGLGEGLVLVSSVNGQLIALDQASGEEKWRATVKGEVLAPAAADNGLVFVQTFSGRLSALSSEDGSERWSYNSKVPVLTLRGTSTPLLFRDQVLVAFANGRVMSFDQQGGAVNWNTRVAIAQGGTEIERIVDIDGEMLLANQLLYAVSYQGQLMAIALDSGNPYWAEDVSSHVGLAEGFGNIYTVTDKSVLKAYSEDGKGLRWQQEALLNRGLSGPVTLGSYVIVADFEGYIHAMSQVDGRIVARTKVDGDGVRARMLVHNKVLYVYGNGGKLAAYRLEDD